MCNNVKHLSYIEIHKLLELRLIYILISLMCIAHNYVNNLSTSNTMYACIMCPNAFAEDIMNTCLSPLASVDYSKLTL